MRWLILIGVLFTVACGGSDSGRSADPTPTGTQQPTDTGVAVAITSTTADDEPMATPTPRASSTSTPVITATASPTASPTVTPAVTPTATPTEPAPTTVAEVDATSEPAEFEGDDPRLLETLPTLDDLPSGWTTSPPSSDDDDDDANFCDAPAFDDELNDVPSADVEYVAGDFGPFLVEAVAYLGESDADRFMDQIRTAMGCETWTQVDEDGTETVWTFAEMSFADIGDDVFARKLTADSGSFPIAGDLVVVRAGEFVVIAINIAVGTVDSSITEDVVRFTVERVDRLDALD